jgi:hypothetical protein
MSAVKCQARYVNAAGEVILTCTLFSDHKSPHLDRGENPWCVSANNVPDLCTVVEDVDATTG